MLRAWRIRAALSYVFVFTAGVGFGAFLFNSLSSKDAISESTDRGHPRYATANSERAEPANPSRSPLKRERPAPEADRYADLILALLVQGDGLVVRSKVSLLVSQWATDSAVDVLNFLIENELYDYVNLVMEVAGKGADEGVFVWLRENSNLAQSVYWYDGYLRSLALVSPAQALQLMDEPGVENQAQSRSIVIDQWAAGEPLAALDWVQTANLDASERMALQKVVLLRYAAVDPWQASSRIDLLSSLSDQQELVSQIAFQLAGDDVSGASDWADTLPQEHRKFAMASVLEHWMSNASPPDIVDYLASRAERLMSQSLFNRGIAEIAARDSKLLIARLSQFPVQSHSEILALAAPELSNVDNADLALLIEGIEPVDLRDFARQSVIESLLKNAPSNAYKLALDIDNNGQRSHYRDLAIRAWGRVNSRDAIQEINASNQWTQKQKRALIDNIQRSN